MPNKSKLTSSIRNFRAVHEGLLRGGQPTSMQLSELSAAGVLTIISLRTGTKAAEKERILAAKLGMKFIHMPIYYLSLPDANLIEQFLDLIHEASRQATFLHCLHGVDRTGFVIAAYRIEKMGWSFDQAYAEMKQCGFHRLRLPHFKWALQNFAHRSTKRTATGNNCSAISVEPG